MNLVRSEKSSIPLYFQLEQIIRSQIITGEFMPGEQILTEKTLCQTYRVSSITARQAILNLVNEGLLIRKQGKGTFVTDEIAKIKTLPLSGKINDLISDGLKTKVKTIDIIKIKPPKRVLNSLNLREGKEVVRVRRTRSEKSIPVSYIVNYLPLEIGKNIQKKDLSLYPMLQILRDQLNIPLRSGIQYIDAVVADHDVSSALFVSLFSPILYIETIIFERQKKPVEFVQSFVRPDRYKYFVKLSIKNGPGNEVRIIRKE
jgi:GntR family transcriptional regulator